MDDFFPMQPDFCWDSQHMNLPFPNDDDNDPTLFVTDPNTNPILPNNTTFNQDQQSLEQISSSHTQPSSHMFSSSNVSDVPPPPLMSSFSITSNLQQQQQQEPSSQSIPSYDHRHPMMMLSSQQYQYQPKQHPQRLSPEQHSQIQSSLIQDDETDPQPPQQSEHPSSHSQVTMDPRPHHIDINSQSQMDIQSRSRLPEQLQKHLSQNHNKSTLHPSQEPQLDNSSLTMFQQNPFSSMPTHHNLQVTLHDSKPQQQAVFEASLGVNTSTHMPQTQLMPFNEQKLADVAANPCRKQNKQTIQKQKQSQSQNRRKRAEIQQQQQRQPPSQSRSQSNNDLHQPNSQISLQLPKSQQQNHHLGEHSQTHQQDHPSLSNFQREINTSRIPQEMQHHQQQQPQQNMLMQNMSRPKAVSKRRQNQKQESLPVQHRASQQSSDALARRNSAGGRHIGKRSQHPKKQDSYIARSKQNQPPNILQRCSSMQRSEVSKPPTHHPTRKQIRAHQLQRQNSKSQRSIQQQPPTSQMEIDNLPQLPRQYSMQQHQEQHPQGLGIVSEHHDRTSRPAQDEAAYQHQSQGQTMSGLNPSVSMPGMSNVGVTTPTVATNTIATGPTSVTNSTHRSPPRTPYSSRGKSTTVSDPRETQSEVRSSIDKSSIESNPIRRQEQHVGTNAKHSQSSTKIDTPPSTTASGQNSVPASGTGSRVTKPRDKYGRLRKRLKCYSKDELMEQIIELVRSSDVEEKRVFASSPRLNIDTYLQECEQLQHTFSASIPAETTSANDSIMFKKYKKQWNTFKQGVINLGKKLVDATLWVDVIKFCIGAIEIVQKVPSWEDTINDKVRSQLISKLVQFSEKAATSIVRVKDEGLITRISTERIIEDCQGPLPSVATKLMELGKNNPSVVPSKSDVYDDPRISHTGGLGLDA